MSVKGKNLAAVLHGVEDLRLEERPIPIINDDQVLIAMDTVGICGSDVHFLVHGRIGGLVLEKPMVLGHEGAGVVAQVGKNVTSLNVGDRVALEMGVPCSKCRLCRRGKYNLCPCVIFGSAPPHDGCLQRYFVHYPEFCFKLTDNMLMEHGALMEPLSVGIHACRRAEIQLGSIVAIFGAGPIGLATLMVVKNMGASKILVADLVASRLSVAKELGADLVLEIKKGEPEEIIVQKIHELMGEEPDRTLDCSGFEATNRLSILTCANGGIALIVGNGPVNVNLPLMNALMREVDLRGIYRYTDTYPAARSLISTGKANMMRLVTHHFNIDEVQKAFETSRHGLGGAIKVLIHLQPQGTNNKKSA